MPARAFAVALALALLAEVDALERAAHVANVLRHSPVVLAVVEVGVRLNNIHPALKQLGSATEENELALQVLVLVRLLSERFAHPEQRRTHLMFDCRRQVCLQQ